MTRKTSFKKELNLTKEIKTFLRCNPEIERSLKIFGISERKYNEAVNASSGEATVISFKNTQWQHGNN